MRRGLSIAPFFFTKANWTAEFYLYSASLSLQLLVAKYLIVNFGIIVW